MQEVPKKIARQDNSDIIIVVFFFNPEEVMNRLLFSHPFRKLFQIVLLLAILLFNFGAASVTYAAPPSNDDFANATVVTVIAYSIPSTRQKLR
jgi:hypothetical protein